MTIERVDYLYWIEWNDSSYEAWIELVSHGIICLISLFLFFIYYWVFICHKDVPCLNGKSKGDYSSILKNNKSGEFNVHLRRLLFIGILSGLLYNIIMYFGNTFLILILNIRLNKHCFYRVLTLSLFALQRIISYAFMLTRLHIAFRGSILALPKYKLHIFNTIIIIVFSILELAHVYVAYTLNGFECNIRQSILVLGLIVASGLTDIIACITITTMFVSRLNILTKYQNSDVLSLKMKRLVRKLSILTMVVVLSAIMSTGFASINVFTYQIYGLDLIINCCCLMLSFRELDYQYKKCCGCCISLSKTCCMKQLSNEIAMLKFQSITKNASTASQTSDGIASPSS